MPEDTTASLDKLREEIDRIDGELHRLLRERAAVVKRIGLAKRTAGGSNAAFVRPGREAGLMRGLLERHDGALPAATVARIWREIMSAACFMQQPLRVALYAPERSISHWDLVRNHFGVLTPIRLCGSPQRVLQEAGEGNGAIGVLPWPEHDEAQPWWPNLAAEDSETMNIVGVLPFYESATGRFESRRMMVVATYPPEASGDDTSYLIARTDPELSRTRLSGILKEADLAGGVMVARQTEGYMHLLLEVQGFVGRDDERLRRVEAASGGTISSVLAVGAAPRPVGVLDGD
ncbi:MAG: chorismate mutase [Minwuia sp.]|uniref:chorismate mutase n=1 Tax=Minwuia sp. TaxID=2493630 RepID=UPI003A8BE249